jgi:hypothetical protein
MKNSPVYVLLVLLILSLTPGCNSESAEQKYARALQVYTNEMSVLDRMHDLTASGSKEEQSRDRPKIEDQVKRVERAKSILVKAESELPKN